MNNRILFILHLPPPVHGSAVVGQQIKDSRIINESFRCNYINLSTSASMNEIGKREIKKLYRYLSILWQVFRQLIIMRPHLCYIALTAKGPAFYKDAMIVLMVKLFRIKVIYHFHNKGIRTNQKKFLDNLLYRCVFKNANVILLSRYLYPDIQKYMLDDRIHYCHNGISEGNVNIEKPAKIGKDNIVEILFLSNLIESKGVYVLLEACKILKVKKYNFHCSFVGNEWEIKEEQFISKVQALGLDNFVNYSGNKYSTEKEKAFAKADIFAFPTFYPYECFPLVILEAIMHGLPVVSTFEGGIPDIIIEGVTGFIVPQKDSIALAEKLGLLIQNRNLREEMGEKGRLRYEQNFTLKHFENNLKTILTECLNKT